MAADWTLAVAAVPDSAMLAAMMAVPMTNFVCLLTAVVSVLGFRNPALHDRLLFRPDRILAAKEWYRLVSSALIHANWMHLGFNMLAFHAFGQMIERWHGPLVLLGIYTAAVLGGSLLSLFLHRHHEYAALGASGGVSGVVFASIFLFPGTEVSALFFPIGIPGPVFALVYLVGTFVALRNGNDNIGHDAHFGGAIVGLCCAALLAPANCLASPVLFTATLVCAGFCLHVLARDPAGISGKVFGLGRTDDRPHGIRYQYHDEAKSRRREQEVDRILDKIASHGMDSLTERERGKLQKLAARGNGKSD